MEVNVKDLKNSDFSYIFAKYKLDFDPNAYRAQQIRKLISHNIRKVYIPNLPKKKAMNHAKSFATQTYVNPLELVTKSTVSKSRPLNRTMNSTSTDSSHTELTLSPEPNTQKYSSNIVVTDAVFSDLLIHNDLHVNGNIFANGHIIGNNTNKIQTSSVATDLSLKLDGTHNQYQITISSNQNITATSILDNAHGYISITNSSSTDVNVLLDTMFSLSGGQTHSIHANDSISFAFVIRDSIVYGNFIKQSTQAIEAGPVLKYESLTISERTDLASYLQLDNKSILDLQDTPSAFIPNATPKVNSDASGIVFETAVQQTTTAVINTNDVKIFDGRNYAITFSQYNYGQNQLQEDGLTTIVGSKGLMTFTAGPNSTKSLTYPSIYLLNNSALLTGSFHQLIMEYHVLDTSTIALVFMGKT